MTLTQDEFDAMARSFFERNPVHIKDDQLLEFRLCVRRVEEVAAAEVAREVKTDKHRERIVTHCERLEVAALSFRERCAIAAMGSMDKDDWHQAYAPDGWQKAVEEVARISFEIADAMEAERQKRGEK